MCWYMELRIEVVTMGFVRVVNRVVAVEISEISTLAEAVGTLFHIRGCELSTRDKFEIETK